ncbi:MAG: transglycosylase SLT domain-containing protein [Bacteriovoracaceae bacterium]
MKKSKEKKELIKKTLEKSFLKEDCVECYFIKMSKEFQGHQHKIIFKTRKKISPEKIKQADKNLKIEIDKSIELFRWSDIIGKVLPISAVYKTPFFDSRSVKVYSPWRVCPIGYHWVNQHNRQKKNLEDVDPHCRRNPSNKDLIKSDEIDFISQTDIFLNPPVKVSKKSMGLDGLSLDKQNQYDDYISGWTAYWNHIFKLEKPLHPNYVKELIASESTFNSKAMAKNNDPKKGWARGLMQIIESTVREMKGKDKDYRDNFVDLEYDDHFNPNRSIAAGVRHLFRKREIAKSKLKREPSWFEVIMDYKGMLKSKTAKSEEIRNNLRRYLSNMDTKL